jgi:hypothetical protein
LKGRTNACLPEINSGPFHFYSCQKIGLFLSTTFYSFEHGLLFQSTSTSVSLMDENKAIFGRLVLHKNSRSQSYILPWVTTPALCVNIYNATSSLVHYENKNVFFYFALAYYNAGIVVVNSWVNPTIESYIGTTQKITTRLICSIHRAFLEYKLFFPTAKTL